MRNILYFLVCIASIPVSFGGFKAPQCWERPHVKKPDCKIKFKRYYYDLKKNECIFFELGQCQIEPINSFIRKEECERYCGVRPIFADYMKPAKPRKKPGVGSEPDIVEHTAPYTKNLMEQLPGISDVCSQPIEKGLCKASMRRYAFNYKTGICEIFTYGGCGGNENNFRKNKECCKACHNGRKCIKYSYDYWSTEHQN